MLKRLAATVLILAAALTPREATAFSLLGPFDAQYQTPDIGYGINIIINAREQDLGGPMNLEEEYRWQSPILVYGFDITFTEYFGPAGIAAVDAAMKVINDLPKASEMSAELTEFPLETARYNYTAQQLRIIDVKSLALSAMLEQLGLAAPERYAYTLRARTVLDPANTYYTVIQRNFAPAPVNPTVSPNFWEYTYSPFVNGTLYTYLVRHHRAFNGLPEFWDAQDIALDAANPKVSVVGYTGIQAGLVDPRVYNQLYPGLLSPGSGLFFTGLTRDDAGGLRHLLHPARTNAEVAPPGSFRGRPVSTPTVVDTRRDGTPWQIYIPIAVATTNAAGGTTTTATNIALVSPAHRAGVNKVSLVRLDADSFLGRFIEPLIVRYPETVWDPTARRYVTQSVERQLSQPDLLFSAADLGVAFNVGFPYVFSRQLGFVDNSQINTASGNPAAGPGNLVPGQIILNKLGPWSINVNETPEEQGLKGYIFGTFDGTTNAPVVFPQGIDVNELERRIYGSN